VKIYCITIIEKQKVRTYIDKISSPEWMLVSVTT